MRAKEELPGVNMTALIDVIFMLVIFFILTAKMEETTINEAIKMAMAPHGTPVVHKDPRTTWVDVDAKGRIYINSTEISPGLFRKIINKAVGEYGRDTPIVITGDAKARHIDVKRVMDICTEAGIYKLKFAALKEKG